MLWILALLWLGRAHQSAAYCTDGTADIGMVGGLLDNNYTLLEQSLTKVRKWLLRHAYLQSLHDCRPLCILVFGNDGTALQPAAC